jgi:hypothetical protein
MEQLAVVGLKFVLLFLHLQHLLRDDCDRVSDGVSLGWLQASFTQRTIHLAWLVPLGAAAYFATLWAFGFRLGDFKRRTAV